MTKDEALDLALEALERLDGWLALRYGSGLTPQEQQVVTAIKQAKKSNIKQVIHLYDEPPAAPVQEPAWYHAECDDPDYSRFTQEKDEAFAIVSDKGGYVTPLYTVPPAAQRQWVGLNWEDMPDIRAGDHAFLSGAQWAEAKLKEKNT